MHGIPDPSRGLLHLPQAADVLAGLLLIPGDRPGANSRAEAVAAWISSRWAASCRRSSRMAGSSSVSSRWRVQSLLRWKDSRESQGQQADLLGAAQEIRQIFDPAADSLAGQDGQIIRFDHKKRPAPRRRFWRRGR